MSSEMTDREIDIALAKVLGGKWHKVTSSGTHYTEFIEHDWSPTSSLDRIDAAVRSWATTPERKVAYVRAVSNVVNTATRFSAGAWYLHYFDLMIATPRQRSEALLAAAGAKA